jgi:hypothetical protein
MNHTTIGNQITKARGFNLNLTDAPAFGNGSMAAPTERTFAMLAHLFPLIIWPWMHMAKKH